MNWLPSKSNSFSARWLPSLMASLLLTAAIPAAQAELKDSPKTIIDEVWQIVNHEFVDSEFNKVDWQEQRRELLDETYTSSSEAYRAIRKALKLLNDPYTRFLSPGEFEAITSQTSGELTGVGLFLVIDQRTNFLTIADVVDTSPAQEAQLQSGDRIVKIDGKPTALMTLEQASEAIRGEEGTSVNLQIDRPGDEVRTVELTRVQIELPSVSYALNDENGLQVGYIKLDEFSSHAAEQMKKAIDQLTDQQAKAFVLDLRGNPGGLLFASVEISRMWLDSGAIVRTTDRQGGDREFAANGSAITDLPLAILVDDNSASASEIVAGALKENRRATVIGTTTYGKGTVQSLHSLSDGSGITVTISEYFPPSGEDINRKGIQPDIYLELSETEAFQLESDPTLLGTPADPQYQRAVLVLRSQSLVP